MLKTFVSQDPRRWTPWGLAYCYPTSRGCLACVTHHTVLLTFLGLVATEFADYLAYEGFVAAASREGQGKHSEGSVFCVAILVLLPLPGLVEAVYPVQSYSCSNHNKTDTVILDLMDI